MTNVNNRCSSQDMNSVPFEYKVRVLTTALQFLKNCETWSVTFNLRAWTESCEKRMLKRIFGPNGEEVS
jgi:hypothetical protein